MNQAKTEFIRFQKVLHRGLAVGVQEDVLKSDLVGYEIGENYQVVDGPEETSSIRCSGTSIGGDLFTDLILDRKSERPLTITFPGLPYGLMSVSRRLNVRQRSDRKVLGLAFARFPMNGTSEENSPFYAIKDRATFDDYINLDCLSDSQTWNPLFVKYHLAVADAFKANEYGYLRIDVNRNRKSEIVVKVSRVQESGVPDNLKTAETLPR